MTKFEPKIIKGVVAFPNEEGNHEIRFIDTRYNTFFYVPNGQNVMLTALDGEKRSLRCEYIDDTHAQIGNEVFHICQFAEACERASMIYKPEHPKKDDILDTYEIFQLPLIRPESYHNFDQQNEEKDLSPSDYEKVYHGMLPKKMTLENIYSKHSCIRPAFGKQIFPFSINDVVVITRGEKREAFYLSVAGFKEVPQFLVK